MRSVAVTYASLRRVKRLLEDRGSRVELEVCEFVGGFERGGGRFHFCGVWDRASFSGDLGLVRLAISLTKYID